MKSILSALPTSLSTIAIGCSFFSVKARPDTPSLILSSLRVLNWSLLDAIPLSHPNVTTVDIQLPQGLPHELVEVVPNIVKDKMSAQLAKIAQISLSSDLTFLPRF